MRRILLLCVLICTNLITFGFSIDEQSQFTKGLTAYEAGDYQAAINEWSTLENAGFESFELHYNLGNAYFKKEGFPHAILYFEKALKVKPFNADVKNNLNLANDRIVLRIKPLPDFFLKQVWRTISNVFSSNTWSVLALLLFWLGIAWITAKMLNWSKGRFRGNYILGGLLVGLSLFLLLLGKSRGKLEYGSHTAIVIESNIELRSAPESTVEVMELPEGTKLIIVDKIGTWEKVEAPNGELGWINETDAVKI